VKPYQRARARATRNTRSPPCARTSTRTHKHSRTITHTNARTSAHTHTHTHACAPPPHNHAHDTTPSVRNAHARRKQRSLRSRAHANRHLTSHYAVIAFAAGIDTPPDASLTIPPSGPIIIGVTTYLDGAREKMDTLGFEPRAFRMRSGCDTTTPCALCIWSRI
jgi:hypothetical protein